MLNVFLVDDEPNGLENLEFVLSQFPDISVRLKTTDPREALSRMDQLKPDVVFLDISMPEMSGLALAEKLYPARIVFVTAHENFAIDAYAFNTIDYILKPVTFDKLRRTIRKIEKDIEENRVVPSKEAPESFMGFYANCFHAIARNDAQYIYTGNRKVLLVYNDREYELKNSISYWAEKLESHGWFRCHRNFLINLSQIDMVEPMSNSVYYVTMKNCSKKVVVSRQYSGIFRGLFEL